MYSISGTTLIGVRKGTDGLWLEVLAPTSEMTLDTTASTYAIGCVITNTANAERYVNEGTVATPLWKEVTGPYNEKSISITLSAAQIIALYTTSIEVIPAVAGKAIVLDSMELDLTGTATQFTGGGVVNLQYSSAANGAGTTLHADIAAAVVTGATARTITSRIGKDQSSLAVATAVNVGVYIGAKTAVFATGTGTAVVRAKYHLV